MGIVNPSAQRNKAIYLGTAFGSRIMERNSRRPAEKSKAEMTVRIAFGLDCRGSADAVFWSSIGSQRKHLVALGE